MDHKVYVVQQNPIPFTPPFNRVRVNAKIPLEPSLNLIGNRYRLPIVARRCN